MSYIALYRKFRPDSFSEVKGQDHIVTTLQNQIANDRVGHAYLFCGTRGTGKTTMAKLLAKTVNCENPGPNGPCCECATCKAIADGTSLNVIEIDAASNNGVDNIRQINEAVQYSPAQGKYIVYIIDEAHMLSKGAYNAMLKTLEEPPEYVIFILATTDDQTLPITIKSRCQRYDFHRISLETIADRLEDIVKREGGQATRDALNFIARSADGSMRDALSILDECMSASMGKTLDREGVLNTIGAVSVDIYVEMLKAISANEPEKVLDLINETIWAGKDLVKFVDDYTWFMRNVLFLKLSPKVADELDMTEETINQLIELGKGFSMETLTRYLNILQELCSSIRNSTVKRVTMEMAFIKMMRPETDEDYSAVIGRLERLEAGGADIPFDIGPNGPGMPGDVLGGIGEGAVPGASNRSTGIMEEQLRELQATLEKTIEDRVDETIQKMIRSGQLSAASGEGTFVPADPKKQSEIIEKNIREKFEPAAAEDIMNLSKRWNSDIIPQLDVLTQNYLSMADMEPSSDYTADGPARLRLVFNAMDEDDVRFKYFSKDENRSKLADKLSGIIKKQVEIDIITKKIGRGSLDESSTALGKINFDNITYKESEDE